MNTEETRLLAQRNLRRLTGRNEFSKEKTLIACLLGLPATGSYNVGSIALPKVMVAVYAAQQGVEL